MKFIFLSLFFLSELSFAQSCPFKASDSNAISMASTTAGTIQGLLDAKNQCSATFTEAVKSVQGLPELLNAAKDPILELTSKKDFLNREIAKSLSDPSYASGTKSGYYENYLEYLLVQRDDLDKQIAEEKIKVKHQRTDNSKEKVLSLTWNLLAASSNALNDPNSPCAKNISNRFGTQLLTLGMGALSSAGYLVSQVAGGGITLAAGLLSQIMDLFSKMPERGVLRDFEENNQTYDLACLYHNIVTLSCDMKSSVGKKVGQSVVDQANKIPNSKTYSKVVSAKEINSDLSTLIMSIATQDVSMVASSEGSNFDRELSDLTADKATMTDKDNWDRVLRRFEFAKKYLVTDPASFEKLTTTQKDQVRRNLTTIYENMYSIFESEGLSLRTETGAQVNYNDFFKKNNVVIGKLIQKRLNEASGSTDGTMEFDNIADLHRGINIKDLRAKNAYTLKAYDELRSYLKDSKTDETPDGKSLLVQIDQAEKVLQNLEKWFAVDPSKPEYKANLTDAAKELKKSIAAKRDDSYTIREKVKFMMAQPFSKFQQLVGDGQKVDEDNVFSNPFKPKSKSLSDFDRYSVLRDVYKSVADPRIELKDINLVNDTRQLFEANNSTLRTNFLKGLKGLKDRMSSSPDPEVSKRMLSQLCGLAYSLPSGSSAHASDECTGMLPKDMQPFMRTGGKEAPDCTYNRYVNEKTRTEYFETGRTPSLPSDSGQGVK